VAGSEGRCLMATTPNYGWVTPAPTDFVTDLPADFETFADAVDDTLHDLNPETTEGDLAYLSATPDVKTRLGIGTAGQVLAVNTGATAPEWVTLAAPPAAELTFTLLNAGGTSLTGAQTISVTGLSGYDAYFILVVTASSANASSSISIRPNGDATAANYNFAGYTLQPASVYAATDFRGAASTSSVASMTLGQTASNSGGALSASVTFQGGNSTGLKVFQITGGGNNFSAADIQLLTSRQGLYNASAVISSFDILSSTGNFDNGTIYIYGGQ